MIRLGFRLALNGGREALIRLLLTMTAVAVGVAVLLAVFADFHAFQVTNRTPSWGSTAATADGQTTSHDVLWNNSQTIYKGRSIKVLDVATLGSTAPTLPGLSKLPKAGEYDVSPALATLLRNTPSDELGDRFPGKQVGLLSDKALTGPNDLAIVVGYSPSQLVALPNTIRVSTISTSPSTNGTTGLYRIAFGAGAIALLFPLLILISTATRLSAARREERYAAMRLVGATPQQINIVASIDAAIAAFLGTILGTIVFLLLRPALADVSFSGAKFFANYVTPTVIGYLAMLIIVPIAAAITALVSLRRVQISPLGVTRKTTPPNPKAWRVVPLLVGIALVTYPVSSSNPHQQLKAGPVDFGLLLIMFGLVLGGSWLTMQASRVLTKTARGASSLLAARRLADNPRAAFRSVSGLVLAVFIGTVMAVLAPTINAVQNSGNNAMLNNVLRVSYVSENNQGLAPQKAANLLQRLQAYSGATAIPLYSNPNFVLPPAGPKANGPQVSLDMHNADFRNSIISCQSLAQLSVLGTCPTGATAVEADASGLFTDNPLVFYRDLPLVSPSDPVATGDFSALPMTTLLIKTDNQNTLEKVRTLLTSYGATTATNSKEKASSPQTFGEVAQIRDNDTTNAERVILAGVILTLLVAGCSLAVSVGGSLVERKRPFSLLRLTGTPIAALYRVVILESTLPLLTASVVAAGVGLGVGMAVVKTLVPAHTNAAYPQPAYYIVMGAGLAVALLAIAMTLPLLGKLTQPEDARFE